MRANKKITNSSIAILLFVFVSCNLIAQTKALPATGSQAQNNIDVDNQLLHVFETGDVTVLDKIIAPDFVNHAGMSGDSKGIANLKTMVNGFHSRFGTVKMEIKRQWADDEYVSDWIRFTGFTSTMVVEGIELTRYSNGKAVEHWFFSNSQRN